MNLYDSYISGTLTVSGAIVPTANIAFDLGTTSNQWRHLYVGSGSVYMGGNRVLGLNNDGSIQLGLQTVQTSASLATYTATGGTATNAFTGAVYISGTLNVSNNLIVTGSITAQQYIISSSVSYFTESFASGSNKFGDTIDDYHDFTGSLRVTGSASIIGPISASIFTGSFTGSLLGTATTASFINPLTQSVNINGNTLVTGSLYVTTGSINSYGNGGNAFFGSSVVTAQTNVAQFQNGNAGVTSYTTITSAGTGSAVASWNTGNSQIIEFVPQSGNGIIDAYTGNLILQTGRVNAVTINSSQQTSFAGNTTVTGSITSTVSSGNNFIVEKSGGGAIAYTKSGTNSLLLEDDGAKLGVYGWNGSAWINAATIATGSSTFSGSILPDATGTRDLGSATLRWGTVYTSDLSLNNGIGDWTIVEGEDDLFLYNNKKGKVYKFALTEVDPSVATPKMS